MSARLEVVVEDSWCHVTLLVGSYQNIDRLKESVKATLPLRIFETKLREKLWHRWLGNERRLHANLASNASLWKRF